MACVKLYVALGARHENFIMFDKRACCIRTRTIWMKNKRNFANSGKRSYPGKAMKDADVFVGLSLGNVVYTGYGKEHGKKSNCICHGKSRS